MKDLLSREFRYSDLRDYLPGLIKNKGIKVSKRIQEIFSPDFSGRAKLLGALKQSGLIDENGSLIKSINQLEVSIDSGIPKDEEATMRRVLGQILTMQSSINVPDDFTGDKTILNKDGFTYLKKTLSGFGLDVTKLDSFYYERLINILNTKRFKESRLSSGQTDFVLQAVVSGFGENNLKPEGTSNNFILKKIAMFGDDNFAAEYNNFIAEVSNKSKGLVDISNETIDVGILEKPMLMQQMKNSLLGRNTYDSNLALGSILEALTQNGLGFHSDRIKNFIAIAPDLHQSKIQRILFDLGIFKYNEETGKIDIDDGKVKSEEYWEKVDVLMNRFGYTENLINQRISEQKQLSKPRFINDSSDHNANPSMSVGEFFRKYKVIEYDSDGNFKKYKDYSVLGQENQINKFDELTNNFPEIENPNAILKGNAITNLYENLVMTRIVNGKEEVIPFENMGGLKNKMIEDATQVFFGRRKQVEVQVIEVAGTGIRFTDKPEFHQSNPIYELFNGLKIKHYVFDNNVLIKPFDPKTSRMEPRIVNLTSRDNTNFPKWITEEVEKVQKNITDDLIHHGIVKDKLIDRRHNKKEDLADLLFQDDVVSIGKDPLIRLNLMPEFDSIVITGQDRKILTKALNDFYERNKSLYEEGNETKIEGLIDRIKNTDDDRYSSDTDYENAARLLLVEKMLISSENTKLKEILNSSDSDAIDKVISRIKLVNTKNFIRGDSDYYLSLSEARSLINKNDLPASLLKERIYEKKGKYSISIWDDTINATIRDEVLSIMEKYKDIYDLTGWGFENIGTAHEEATSFDSISFVTKEAMMEFHTLMGHDPNSKNAIKPVISSMGEGKTLLLGKTLFIHDPNMQSFLTNNGIDILLSKSGAKVYDEKYIDGNPSKDDESILQSSVEGLRKAGNILKPNQKRFLDIDAIGLKPEKDASITSAKDSPADANYHNSEEGNLKMQEMKDDITFAIQSIENIVGNSVSMREFMMDELLPHGQLQSDDGISSLQTINNMYLFLEHNANSNPMSFSDNQVKNKIFNTFIDRLINNTRSITNRSSGRHGVLENVESNRYGGQSYIIQGTQMFLDRKGRMRNNRLLPSLVDKQGNILMRGELALPFHEQNTKLGNLEGRTIRIVDNEKVFTVDEFLKDYKSKVGEEDKKNELSLSVQNSTLGEVHNFLKKANKETNRKYQIGIISRRNPRTRPNDITLLGLAGFLDEGYGNSTMVNSLDIVNVYEGDYDADKVDYFFAHNDYMFDHIKRTNKYYVQGLDPKKWQRPSSFTFLQDSDEQSKT